MNSEVLKVEQLTCSFSGVIAVDDVSLSCTEGEITGVIGPNGAGKSTLLGCVAGAVAPQSGSIRFQGKQIGGLKEHQVARAGVVRTFQIANVFPRLTVMENLLIGGVGLQASSLRSACLGRRRWGATESEAIDRARELLGGFGLMHLENRVAGELSGGKRRLVEILRALMFMPTMLLLDEPMAGVNPSLAVRFVGYLRELAQRGLTMLLVEHELRYVDALCEKVIVMAEGRVLTAGTMSAICRDQKVIDVYLAG